MTVKRKWGLETTSTGKEKQQMKDRESDDRDWAEGLPDHLLELVIERLPLVDCLSFSSVCKVWENVTTKILEGSSREIPLVVKPRQGENTTRTCLYVLGKNKKLTFDIPMPEEYIGSRTWGSYRDWLILRRIFDNISVHITLLNPFSGEEVVLPNTRYDYFMIILSSVPSDPRCVYMLGGLKAVAFWTSGSREWRKCDNLMGSEELVHALYHEGKFYLLKSSTEMVMINEKSVINMLNIDGSDNSSLVTQNLGFSIDIKPLCVIRKCIVESSGDILLVCHEMYGDGRRGFETYKMDVSGREWVKLESVGDTIIFLGESCSRSFHAKEELGEDALANNIYFSNTSYPFYVKDAIEWSDDGDWGIFSLREEASLWPRALTGKQWTGVWVTAPIWWCFSQLTLRWIAPGLGMYMLNTDGAFGRIKGAGGGGILRNMVGDIIFAFSTKLRDDSGIGSEVNALLTGLKICHSLSIHDIQINIDSLTLVDWFNDESKVPILFLNIWEDILFLFDWLGCEISHVWRGQNSVADLLAKQGAKGITETYFEDQYLPSAVFAEYSLDKAWIAKIRRA